MDHSISIALGTPKHGWLPVEFHYLDFHLDFSASDVLNDPIEELYNVVTNLHDKDHHRITWWLEPSAYFFDFKIKGQGIVLTVIETDDLHNENADNKQLLTIIGDDKLILKPVRNALRHFASQAYEEKHWAYIMDLNKIKNL